MYVNTDKVSVLLHSKMVDACDIYITIIQYYMTFENSTYLYLEYRNKNQLNPSSLPQMTVRLLNIRIYITLT